ncbi:MAG: cation:proton antiporter [Planctomycetota bacterium]
MSAILATGVTDPIVRDLAVVFVGAAAGGWIMHRLKMSTIPGYLLAGVLIANLPLGLISDKVLVEEVGHLALVLLMFVIGLHLELPKGKGGVLKPILVGAVSTPLVAVLAAPFAKVLGIGWAEAITLGLAASMSSTAVVLNLLAARRETNQSVGRLSLGVLLTQDMLVILMLAAIPAIAIWSGAGQDAGGDAEQSLNPAALLIAGGGVVVLVAGIRWGLPKAFRLAAARSDTELLLVFSGCAALGAGTLATAIGFSAELGAFISGFVLSATPFRHQVEGMLTPVRDLLLAVFFVWVGLGLDLGQLGSSWWVVVPGLLVVFAVKVIAIGGSAMVLGMSAPISVRTAATLGQAGEFGLVILAAGRAAGLIGDSAAAVFIAITTVSLMLTPAMAELGLRTALGLRNLKGRALGASESHQADEKDQEGADGDHVIIAGFGPIGRALSRQLELRSVPTLIVDLNAETIRSLRARGNRAIFGDITNRAVLAEAGIVDARAVVVTVPDDQAVLKACRVVRSARPDVLLSVRTGLMSTGLLAREAGADLVTVSEIATADAMAREVAERIGKLDSPRAGAASKQT